MRDFDETTITDAVLARMSATPDDRLHAIMRSLVTHLHGFVRDIRPTFDEWGAAIDFLTRVGQMCSDTRQEFILLSDTLGVSMLVDAINNGSGGESTESTVLGPFYVAGAPVLPNGANVAGPFEGETLFIEGTVSDAAGPPIAGATVDIWHSDAEGFYDVQHSGLAQDALRGRFRTDPRGRFWFWTIMPHSYPVPDGGPVGDMLAATKRHPFRPAHVHFMIQAPGFEKLVTHVFVDGDRYLDSDAVFAVKQALVRDFTREPPGAAPDGTEVATPWRHLAYDFRLIPTSQRKAA
jgi:hydroxyquinol 1,2-dioxygenase